ncbi:MAG: hypothetical protein ABIQ93_07800, partial [Saprospiraceae bacterium]
MAATSSTVTVTVGNKPAQVNFAGLTPGFAGVYQVNAILAADTPVSNSVPLLIQVDGLRAHQTLTTCAPIELPTPDAAPR